MRLDINWKWRERRLAKKLRRRVLRCPTGDTAKRRQLAAFFSICGILSSLSSRAFAAAQDPAGVVGRTTEFLLNLLVGVGVCFIAFGVLALALSFQSHDDSQKSKAVMAIMGGAIAVSVKYVIQIVAPNAGISI